jgi:pimeloyl-ACP methyl ester carboxylesterase
VLDIHTDTFAGTFPFVPHYQALGHFRMHYVDEGVGEPLVLLHGDPTWGYLYRHFIPPLAQRFRCVVTDHMGMGHIPPDYVVNRWASITSSATFVHSRITGLDNQLIAPDANLRCHRGQISQRERLGGLLRYYYRDAA